MSEQKQEQKQSIQFEEVFDSGTTFTTINGTCFCTCYVTALTDSTTVGNRSASNPGRSVPYPDLRSVNSGGLTRNK